MLFRDIRRERETCLLFIALQFKGREASKKQGDHIITQAMKLHFKITF